MTFSATIGKDKNTAYFTSEVPLSKGGSPLSKNKQYNRKRKKAKKASNILARPQVAPLITQNSLQSTVHRISGSRFLLKFQLYRSVRNAQ